MPEPGELLTIYRPLLHAEREKSVERVQRQTAAYRRIHHFCPIQLYALNGSEKALNFVVKHGHEIWTVVSNTLKPHYNR